MYRSEQQRKAIWANSTYGAPTSGPHWSRKVLPRGRALTGRGGRARRRRAVLGGLTAAGIGTALAAGGAYGRFLPGIRSALGVTGQTYAIDWAKNTKAGLPQVIRGTFHVERPAGPDEVAMMEYVERVNKPLANIMAKRMGWTKRTLGRGNALEEVWHVPGVPADTRWISRRAPTIGEKISKMSLLNLGGRGELYDRITQGSVLAQKEATKVVRRQLGRPLERGIGRAFGQPFRWGQNVARALDDKGVRFLRKAAGRAGTWGVAVGAARL